MEGFHFTVFGGIKYRSWKSKLNDGCGHIDQGLIYFGGRDFSFHD
jgi:hypothetical protein